MMHDVEGVRDPALRFVFLFSITGGGLLHDTFKYEGDG